MQLQLMQLQHPLPCCVANRNAEFRSEWDLNLPVSFDVQMPWDGWQAAALAQGTAVSLNAVTLVASVLVGAITAIILFCSHFHQIDGDRAALKMSPLVRLGSTARGYQVRLLVKLLQCCSHAIIRATYWLQRKIGNHSMELHVCVKVASCLACWEQRHACLI